MWQRKQTLFLLVALVAAAACLCLPVGRYESPTVGADAVMCNLWIAGPAGHDLHVWPLFALLIVACPLMVFAILAFKNRKLQSRICLTCFFLMFVWYAVYILLTLTTGVEGTTFHIAFGACLPLVSALALLWARKGILDDEKLVRSMDRIR